MYPRPAFPAAAIGKVSGMPPHDRGGQGWGLAPMLSLYIHFEIRRDGKKDFLEFWKLLNE